jgi:hypothetical protein
MGEARQRPRPPRSRDETRPAFGPRQVCRAHLGNPSPSLRKPRWARRAVSPSQRSSCSGTSEQHKRTLFAPFIAAARVSCCRRPTKGIDPGIAAEGGDSRNQGGSWAGRTADPRRGRIERTAQEAAGCGVSAVSGADGQRRSYIRTAPAVAAFGCGFPPRRPARSRPSGALTRTVVARPAQAPSRRSRSGRLRPFRHGGNWLRSRFSSLVWRSSRRW